MFFASDNCAPCPEAIIEAIVAANRGHVPSYGNDPLTAEVQQSIRDLFEAPEAVVHFVATGTVANSLGLATLVRPWSSIFCHEEAHIHTTECGAPEFYTDAKLLLVPGPHGRMTPETLEAAIARFPGGSPHEVQPGALSITNVTEAGTVYTPAEVAALTAIAHRHGMSVHMDGARFVNALVATGASPAEMTWKSGIDALSFGGTKGGLMGVEVVIFFDPKLGREFELRRKRGGHLFSKNRYLAAQFKGWLADGLWLETARTANDRAAALAAGLAAIPGVSLAHPVEANIIFVHLPEAMRERLRAAGAQFIGEHDGTTRLVTSWATTEAEVEAFLACARRTADAA